MAERRILRSDGGTISVAKESRFATERDLQQAIAQHPSCGDRWHHALRLAKAIPLVARMRLIALFVLSGLFVVGCTSLGHEQRAIPKIAKPIGAVVEFGFDPDDNELSVAVEKLLDARGIRVTLLSTPQVRQQRGDKEYTYDEVQTRYVLRVRSVDLDTCLPEGSRQMLFSLSVTDFQKRERVLVMKGEFGCRDTIVREFDKWLSSGSAGGVNPSR